MRVAGIDASSGDASSIAVVTCSGRWLTVERTASDVSGVHVGALLADPCLDAIGVNAQGAATLQCDVRDDRVVRASPSVALSTWELPYSGYVARAGMADLAEVRETIVLALTWRLGVPASALRVRDAGQLGALIVALVALMERLGLTDEVASTADALPIHVPAADGLIRLATGAAIVHERAS